MNEVAGSFASTTLDGPDAIRYKSNHSPEGIVDTVNVDDKPDITLRDTIVYQRDGTIANLFDAAVGLQLRAEGTLWVENAEKYKWKFSI